LLSFAAAAAAAKVDVTTANAQTSRPMGYGAEECEKCADLQPTHSRGLAPAATAL